MEATTTQCGDSSSAYPDSQGSPLPSVTAPVQRESIFIPIDILIDIGAKRCSTLVDDICVLGDTAHVNMCVPGDTAHVDMCVLGDSSTHTCVSLCVCAPMHVEARSQMSSSVLLSFYFYYLFNFIYELNLLVYFRGSASLCSSGSSGTHCVDQAVLKLNRSPASAGAKGMYSHYAWLDLMS